MASSRIENKNPFGTSHFPAAQDRKPSFQVGRGREVGGAKDLDGGTDTPEAWKLSPEVEGAVPLAYC